MRKRSWDICGDMKVNFWLIVAIAINLAAGAYSIKYNPTFFRMLNHLPVQDWFLAYGRHQPEQCWWLALLFVLAFILGINTFVCAVKRIALLWLQKRSLGFRAFSLKISPSLIHLCFVAILAGHFISLIGGYELQVPVELHRQISLPQGNSVEVMKQDIEYYTTPASFAGAVKQGKVILRIQNPEKTALKEMRVLHPLFWEGLSIHLDIATKTKSRQTAAPPELTLVIKKDPGVVPMIGFFAVLCLLMFWYFPQRKKI